MSIKKNKKNMGPLVLPLIAAGASLAGSAINAGSQSATNQSQLSYSREMYDKQRADALADWNRQNAYNSPSAQMTRFKEAGLNPNLIYGSMTQSPVVRTSSVEGYSPRAPQVDLGNAAAMGLQGLSTYQDTQLKDVQTNLVKEQIKNASTDNMLKQLDWAKKNAELPYSQELAQQSLEALKLQNSQRLQDLEFGSDINPTKIQSAYQSLDLVNKQIDNIIANTSLTKVQKLNAVKDGVLKDIETKIRRSGGNPNDPGYVKAIQPLIKMAADKIEELIKNKDNPSKKFDGYTAEELLFDGTKFTKWLWSKF
jgi:hypothetical protein